MGVGKYYNPELDYESKIADMRKDWESKQTEKGLKEQVDGGDDDDEEWSQQIHEHFKKTAGAGGSGNGTPLMGPGPGPGSREVDETSSGEMNEKTGGV